MIVGSKLGGLKKMPFPRTYSEELMAEILELEGYKCILGYKVGTGKRGGKKEADIIGVRLKDGNLEIKHCEVGTYYEKADKIYNIAIEKFSEERINAVKSEFAKKYGVDETRIKYEKVLVLPYRVPNLPKVKQLLEKHGIEVIAGQEVIHYLKKVVENWKKENATAKNPTPAIPESLWILKFWEFLNSVSKA
ncbi:MAG: hypothetical protein ACP5KE_09680 [Candidatus Methanodesulfokora sp.]